MILCFGIFASILSCCTQGKPKFEFVPRVAWVVDRRNSSLASGLDFDVDDPDGMEGNKPVVSKLLSCDRPLVLKDKQLPSLQVARERFKSKVMPFIYEDMVAKAVLAILYIISKDETIETEHKESFRRYLGIYKEELLRQTRFDVPDFLTRVLLYTTCVDNNKGRPYAKEITDTFIEKVANDSWTALKWDATSQTLDLIPAKEKRLSEWVDQLCQLRPSVMEDMEGFVNMEWLPVTMTGLDPSIWGRTEIRESDAQRLLSRKINPYVQINSPGPLKNSAKPHRWFKGKSNKSPEDM